MDSFVFEKLFTDVQEDAIKCVRAVLDLPKDKAQDAVQNAAIYVLEHLDRFDEITPSYFKQLCCSRAKDFQKGEGRQHQDVLPIGNSQDIVAHEHVNEARRRGRVKPKSTLSSRDGGPSDDDDME